MAEEKSRRRISSLSVTMVISVSLVLFLLGLLGIFFIGAKKISDHLKENIGFHVYLKDQAKSDEVDRLHNYLTTTNYVKSFSFITKDSAAALYKKDVGEDFVQFIGYNPLPASMEIQLKSEYANLDSIAWIQKQILSFSSVKEFDYQQSLVHMVNKNINRIVFVLLIFIALLLTVALTLINNTIRLAIYSKRFVIKTMQLVGATRGFIRKPFLLNGILHGLLAGIIACLMLSGMIYAALENIPDVEQIIDLQMIFYLFAFVMILGVVISGISTFFAVRKFLRRRSEELHY